MRRNGEIFVDEDGKRKIRIRRRIETKFVIDERHRIKEQRFRIPSTVENIKTMQIIPNNTGDPIRATKRYFGTNTATFTDGLNPTQLQDFFFNNLSHEEIISRTQIIDINFTNNQVIYYASPTAFGVPQLFINGVQNVFEVTPTVVALTDNETGFVEDYYLFKSIPKGTGGKVKLLIL